MPRAVTAGACTRRTAALAAAAVTLLISLTGCLGGSPAATSTPDVTVASPTASPPPTADPADPLTTVVALVARPEGLELRADGGAVVSTLDYMSQPVDAVTALTAAFDTPPVDEPYDGTNHAPPGVFHRWDQFVLDERFYDEDRRQSEGYDWLTWPRFAVYFDGPEANGIVLSASSGLQAGDAWSDAEADPGFDAELWTCIGTSIEAAVTEVPMTRSDLDQVNVIATRSSDGASVKWIGAPEMETDGCA